MARIEAGGVVFEVEAVAFDKDGTLIDLDAAWGPAARAWVETAAGEDAVLLDALATELGLDLATGHLIIGGLFAVGTVGQLYQTTLEVLWRSGLDQAETVVSEARRMSALAGEKGNLVPLGDVTGTFRSLHDAGLKLAIVSSDDRSAINTAIDDLDVGQFLETVVAGDEGLDPKPAPAALIEAARRLGTSPAQLLYVGDSWVDAEAGAAAGVAGTVIVGDPSPDTSGFASVFVAGIDSIRVL